MCPCTSRKITFGSPNKYNLTQNENLCSHNYTIYNMDTKDVISYFCYESQESLEANIFSTILTEFLFDYLLENNSIQEFCSFFYRNEVSISHNYIPKEHTQMEVDSVHSRLKGSLKIMTFTYSITTLRIVRKQEGDNLM